MDELIRNSIAEDILKEIKDIKQELISQDKIKQELLTFKLDQESILIFKEESITTFQDFKEKFNVIDINTSKLEEDFLNLKAVLVNNVKSDQNLHKNIICDNDIQIKLIEDQVEHVKLLAEELKGDLIKLQRGVNTQNVTIHSLDCKLNEFVDSYKNDLEGNVNKDNQYYQSFIDLNKSLRKLQKENSYKEYILNIKFIVILLFICLCLLIF